MDSSVEDLSPVLFTRLNIQEFRKSAAIMNLRVLRNLDPHVNEILATVPAVTLYDFNRQLNRWFERNVEGPLFIVKRTAAPCYQLIVLNRKTPAILTGNVVVDLLDDYEIQVMDNLLVFGKLSGDFTGIWFDKVEKLKDILNHLARIRGPILNLAIQVGIEQNAPVSTSCEAGCLDTIREGMSRAEDDAQQPQGGDGSGDRNKVPKNKGC